VEGDIGKRWRMFSHGKKSQPIYCSGEGDAIVNLPNQLGRAGSAYRVIDDFVVEGRKILAKGHPLKVESREKTPLH